MTSCRSTRHSCSGYMKLLNLPLGLLFNFHEVVAPLAEKQPAAGSLAGESIRQRHRSEARSTHQAELV